MKKILLGLMVIISINCIAQDKPQQQGTFKSNYGKVYPTYEDAKGIYYIRQVKKNGREVNFYLRRNKKSTIKIPPVERLTDTVMRKNPDTIKRSFDPGDENEETETAQETVVEETATETAEGE